MASSIPLEALNVRQPAHRQSSLRNPLNRILGTESAVRILRVLSQTRQPLGAADLARMTMLNPTGVRNSIEDLIGTGILAPVGGGSRSLVRLRPDHPLALPLRRLFAAEAERIASLRKEIGKVARELSPMPRSIWMQGPVADSTDRPDDPLTVGILAADTDLEATVQNVREQLTELEQQQDVTIDVRGFSSADLLTLSSPERNDLARAIPLWGPAPSAFIRDAAPRSVAGSARNHARHDALGLALAGRIVRRLREEPSLIERARKRIAARMKTASAAERKELAEWDRLLRSRSSARLRHLLMDPGQRGTRLRQTLPFLDALSQEERDEVIKASKLP